MDTIPPTKILFVDDEPKLQAVIHQLFREELRQNKLDITFAFDGVEAIDKLKADPEIEIVMTDINMPNMSGLKLLTKLQELKSDLNPVLTAVVVSAYGDMDNIRKAMNSGAFDFLIKPLDFDDVKVTLYKAIAHNQRLKKAIEQEKRAQETLRHMNEELEKRVRLRTSELIKTNAELNAFAYTVAHDLKNPLGLLIGYADYLIEYMALLEKEEILETCYSIQRVGYKAVNIIEELLLLSGVRQREVPLNPVDMEQIIVRSLERLQPMIEQYQGQIIVPDEWPQTKGYGPWLEEVWVNYLSNGLKYSGKSPLLKVGAEKQPDGMLRFWVQDEGPGLTPEAQEMVFTEFTRLSELQVEGHGLGLSIVRRIIEKLGGIVGVESEPGKGCIFYFTLPPC